MGKLDALIAELCPDGVIFEEVGKLSKTLSPSIKIKKNDYLAEGIYPIIDQGQEFIGGYTNEESAFTVDEYIVFGDHTCVVKYIDFAFVQGADGVKVIKADSMRVLPKYLYYCMSNIKMDISYARHWSKIRIEKVPVPPLEVQGEIVRILDAFTEHTTKLISELTSELTSRKNQHNYYRNILLDGDITAKEYYLEEICQVIDCPHTSPKWKESGIPVIRNYNLINGTISTNNLSYVDEAEYEVRIKRAKPQMNDILFSREAPIGNVGIIPAGLKCCQGQRVVLLRANTNIVIPQYLLYILQSGSVQEQIEKVEKIGSTVSNYNISDLRKLKVTIPPFDKQNYSIEKMKKLNTYYFEIKNSLLTEIELCQRQYSYYRDRLLDFKKIGA